MTEEYIIPDPIDLEKFIENDKTKRMDEINNYAVSILRNNKFAEIIRAKRCILILDREIVSLEIEVNTEDLNRLDISLNDLIEPIKKLLSKYDVKIEPKQTSLKTHISVPEKYFQEDEDEEKK